MNNPISKKERIMRTILALALTCLVSSAWSQDEPPIRKQAATEATVQNPFEIADVMGAEGMAGMGMMGGGMEMGMMSAMGGGEGMGEMGMGGMGMGMGGMPDPNAKFRHGLQTAIRMIQLAKSEEEKTVLRNFVREAFENRYDEMLASRQKDLEELRKGIKRLEQEIQRRGAAKERVVQLQLQSVQLAAEGLLDTSDLQGLNSAPAATVDDLFR
jgi:predicted outer membrane protein